MQFGKIGFIGLGLIGGSLAKTIKRIYPDTDIIATSGHFKTIEAAVSDGTISNNSLLTVDAFSDCDLIFLCCPVQKNIEYLQALKNVIQKNCIISDVGSVKGDIHAHVTAFGMEENFIGGHPMAGSEQTGYQAATAHLLENAYYILTPTAKTSASDMEEFKEYIASIGSIPMVMDYTAHDHATASISHLPHIIAASLVNLIAKTDDTEETLKTIAAGGFKDITRIASSSPVMWQHICTSNREQLLSIIDRFEEELNHIKLLVDNKESQAIHDFFSEAKEYRDSITIRKHGALKKSFECFCDLIDEAGGIATIATILASNNLSIKNIGIIHNREFENGVLHIEMYAEDSLQQAIALLRKYHYTVYER